MKTFFRIRTYKIIHSLFFNICFKGMRFARLSHVTYIIYIWNELSNDIKNVNSLSEFRSSISISAVGVRDVSNS